MNQIESPLGINSPRGLPAVLTTGPFLTLTPLLHPFYSRAFNEERLHSPPFGRLPQVVATYVYQFLVSTIFEDIRGRQRKCRGWNDGQRLQGAAFIIRPRNSKVWSRSREDISALAGRSQDPATPLPENFFSGLRCRLPLAVRQQPELSQVEIYSASSGSASALTAATTSAIRPMFMST